MSENKQYLTKPGLAKRWAKTPRTIDRWLADPPPGFPGAVILGGRRHFSLDEVENYERVCAATRFATSSDELATQC